MKQAVANSIKPANNLIAEIQTLIMKLNQDLKLLMDYQEEVQREKIKSLIAVQVEEQMRT